MAAEKSVTEEAIREACGRLGALKKGEVYVTNGGTKYHADGCKFLAKSKIPCTLADAKAKKYEPCSVCHPPK